MGIFKRKWSSVNVEPLYITVPVDHGRIVPIQDE